MKRIALAMALVIVAAAGVAAQGGQAVSSEEVTVWSGARTAFEKPDGADPGAAANQDRITDGVWLTRGNDGGQIYNAAEESDASKDASPEGTLWALGTTADLEALEFAPFREAVGKPQEIVGKDLVLYIPAEQIVLDVRFTAWSEQRRGGFAYERSTP